MSGGDKQTNGSLTIVCSDCPRNGKTILAKLAADLLTLRSGAAPVIYDTDEPNGDILSHFPHAARVVDLAKTNEQMRLFDGVLSQGGHHLVDLSAHHFFRFFDIYRDIGFEQGAVEAGVDVHVLCIVDRSAASVSAAENLFTSLRHATFSPVRNNAIGDVLDEAGNAAAFERMSRDRALVLPALTGEALGVVEHPNFHFDGFVAGRFDTLAFELKSELWDFLEVLYEQRASVDGRSSDPV